MTMLTALGLGCVIYVSELSSQVLLGIPGLTAGSSATAGAHAWSSYLNNDS